MTTILQNLYDGALGAARGLTILQILRRLGIVAPLRRPSSPWQVDGDDIGLLSSAQGAVDSGIQVEIWTPTPSDDHFRGEDAIGADLTQGEPILVDGPPTVMITNDPQGQLCFATPITKGLIDTFSDIVDAKAKCEAKEAALAKLRPVRSALQQRAFEHSRSNPSPHQSNSVNEIKSGGHDDDEKLHELTEEIEGYEMEIKAHQTAIASDQRRIHKILELALEPTALIREAEVEEEHISRFLSEAGDLEENQANDGYGGKQRPAQQETSEEEKALIAARDAFLEAKDNFMMAQFKFDGKELHAHNEMSDWEAAVAHGTAGSTTRSWMDVHVLACKMGFTGELIDAEIALQAAKEQAEALGAFKDGWGCDFDSDYMMDDMAAGSLPSGLNSDQVDSNDFEPPMPDRDRARVDRWLDTVDASKDPEYVPSSVEIEVDEWVSWEPEVHDSMSMVDFGPSGRTIAQWNMECEERRRERREQEGLASSIAEAVGSSLKRRFSL